MNSSFIGKRIPELYMKKGVLEYQMFYNFYISTISSGRSLSLVNGFFAIINFFESGELSYEF